MHLYYGVSDDKIKKPVKCVFLEIWSVVGDLSLKKEMDKVEYE